MLNAIGITPYTVQVPISALSKAILTRYSGSLFDFLPTVFSDSAATTPAVVDGALGIGAVLDRVGALTLTQATSASKPLWRRGAKNLLTYSEQLDNAAWTVLNTLVSPNVVIAPDGSITADKIIETAVNSAHLLYRSSVLLGSMTISVHFSAGERAIVGIGNGSDAQEAVFNTATGAVVSSGSGTISNGRIESVGGGWYRCSCLFNASSAKTFSISIRDASGNRSYLGDGASGIYAWGAQIVAGSEIGAYVKTGASTASNGIGGYWADFDDTDDKLTFSAVPFEMADDHILMIPALPISAGRLYSAGNTTSATPQISLGITAAGYLDAVWKDDAGTTAQITGSVDIRGQKHVFEMRKAGNAKSLWMDGVQVGATENTAMGTTTLNVAKVGCLASTTDSDFVGGGVYGVVPLKGQPSASELNTVRRYLATLIGVSL